MLFSSVLLCTWDMMANRKILRYMQLQVYNTSGCVTHGTHLAFLFMVSSASG